MGTSLSEPVDSFEFANERISWIGRYDGEAEVEDAARQIVRLFGLQVFVFCTLSRNGERERHRCLVGCDPKWCFLYNQNKWYANDPIIGYALRNTAPVLASDIAVSSPGQERMLAAAAEHGFRGGVVVPAHSASSMRVGMLYLGTNEGPEPALQSLLRHRSLMRAFALELLEWWDARLRDRSLAEFGLDELDVELLCKAREKVTAKEAACELGITLSRVNSRYERLNRKLEAPTKRHAVEKAIELGLIKPIS